MYELPAPRRTGRTLTATCPRAPRSGSGRPSTRAPRPWRGAARGLRRQAALRTRPMQPLGTVPASGAVRIDLGPEGKPRLPGNPSAAWSAPGSTPPYGSSPPPAPRACVPPDTPSPPNCPGQHRHRRPRRAPHLRLALRRRRRGTAPRARVPGPRRRPLDGRATTVGCSFRPPGLKPGGAVGAAALLALAATGFLHRRRARR
ncbi:hypothetical protein O1L60_28920 [Streptomyces diastatochromogenes]|nr:hypothetical protein [Streptomyces diastatochromogenes]